MAESPVITSAVANAPGWITIAWAHSGQDGALGYRIDHDQREGYRQFSNLRTSTSYTFRMQGCHVNFLGVANCGPWSSTPVQISTLGPVPQPPPVRVTPIYALAGNGDLLWYDHEGRNDGSFTWAFPQGKKVGNQWNFRQVFSGGDGIIYAITDNGDLMWSRHEGRNDGSFRWASNAGSKVGSGWNFKQVFSG